MARRLFLERRTYRQYRLQDAARLLPILGLILIFGPILIRGDDAGALTLAGGLIYYFAIWVILIGLTALVSRALVGDAPHAAETDGSDGPSALPPAGDDS